MDDSPFLELFRWHDQEEEFFALFVRANGLPNANDGVIIRLIEVFFLTFFLVDTLIPRSDYFELIVFLEIEIVIVRWINTTTRLRFHFVLTISLSPDNPYLLSRRPALNTLPSTNQGATSLHANLVWLSLSTHHKLSTPSDPPPSPNQTSTSHYSSNFTGNNRNKPTQIQNNGS